MPAPAEDDPAGGAAAVVPEAAKENIGRLTEVYQNEAGATSMAQRVIEAVSTFCGSPGYFVFAIVFVVAWCSYNEWAKLYHHPVFDAPPYYGLQGLVSLNALLLTIAVLIRQNRMAELASQRAHLDLQINLLAEHKITKVIQMLERERPGIADDADSDESVEELTAPVDAHAILKAIKSQQEVREAAKPAR